MQSFIVPLLGGLLGSLIAATVATRLERRRVAAAHLGSLYEKKIDTYGSAVQHMDRLLAQTKDAQNTVLDGDYSSDARDDLLFRMNDDGEKFLAETGCLSVFMSEDAMSEMGSFYALYLDIRTNVVMFGWEESAYSFLDLYGPPAFYDFMNKHYARFVSAAREDLRLPALDKHMHGLFGKRRNLPDETARTKVA